MEEIIAKENKTDYKNKNLQNKPIIGWNEIASCIHWPEPPANKFCAGIIIRHHEC